MAIEEIKELDVDGVKVQVADLAPAQQRFVKVYHEVLQKKADAEDEIIALNAAMRSLANDLVISVREARAAVVAAEAAATAPVDAAAVEVVEPAAE